MPGTSLSKRGSAVLNLSRWQQTMVVCSAALGGMLVPILAAELTRSRDWRQAYGVPAVLALLLGCYRYGAGSRQEAELRVAGV